MSVPLSKKSKFILNLNLYRNANFHVLNNAKIAFKEKVTPLLRHIPKLKGCTLEFTLFPGSETKCDVSNVCCIVEKFFNDALVECGKIEDDNYTIVPTSRYNFGEVDKNNPRVEVVIHPIGEIIPETLEENSMQITLVQTEIEQAIRAYVHSQVSVKEGNEITIELKATRGDAGMQAVIDILPAGTTPVVVAKAVTVTPRAGGLGIKTAVVAAKTPAAATTAVVASPVVEEQTESESDVAEEETGTPPEETPVDVESEVEEAETPPVVKPKSLFTGLKKPVNA